MAKKRVNTSDLVQRDLFKTTIENSKNLIEVLSLLKKTLKENASAFKSVSKAASSRDSKSIQELTRAYNALTKLQNESIKLTKSEEDIKQKAEKTEQQRLRTLQQEERLRREKLRTQTLETRESERAERAAVKQGKAAELLNNAYIRLTKQTQAAQFRFKTLAAEFGNNSRQARSAQREFERLDKRLRSINTAAKDGRPDVGRYGLAFKGLAGSFSQVAGAFGIITGIQFLGRTLLDAVNTYKAFELENDRLAALLNTNSEGIKALTEDAKRLGQQTAKSATEVNKLQQAYARLGFTQGEILDLTGDTINGSIALNAELDQTAELTGAVVRTFEEFDTKDAGLILDQLTLSTQKTALNFDKLQTAIPIASGAAAAAKVPFTTFIAQLGQAADRGIDASRSANALKNIYISLSDQGITLQQALERINKSQDKLKESTVLFGRENSVTALALASTVDKTKELDVTLQNAAGTAEKFANETLDNLQGDITLLNSAWEGLILTIESGDGVIGNFFRGAVQSATNFLTALTQIDVFIKTINGSLLTLNDLEFKGFIEFFKVESGKTIGKALDEAGFKTRELAASFSELKESVDEGGAGFREFITLEEKQTRFLEKVRKDLIATLESEGESREDAAEFALRYIDLIKSEAKSVSELNEENKQTAEITEEQIERLGRIEDLRKRIKTLTETRDEGQFNDDQIKSYNVQLIELNKELQRLLDLGKEADVKPLEDFTKQRLEARRQLVQLQLDTFADEIKIDAETTDKKIEQIDLRTEREIRAEEQRYQVLANLAKENLTDEEGNIKDKELLALEEERIEIEKQNAIKGILENANDDKNNLREQDLENARKIAEEQAKVFDALFQSIASGIDSKLDRDIQKIERRISQIEQRRSQLESAAAQGSRDAVESLVLEAKEQEKAELQAEKRRRQQIQIEAGLAAIRIASQKSLEGKPITDALKDVGTIQAVTTAIISGVPGFFKGTEDTGTVDKPLDSKGGRVAVLHDNERVVNKVNNQKLKGISNDKLGDIGLMYKTGQLINVSELNRLPPSVKVDSVSNDFYLKELVKEFKSLPNKMPKSELYYSEHLKAMVEVSKSTYKTQTRIHKPRGGVLG